MNVGVFTMVPAFGVGSSMRLKSSHENEDMIWALFQGFGWMTYINHPIKLPKNH
jgi:hypothetical protein